MRRVFPLSVLACVTALLLTGLAVALSANAPPLPTSDSQVLPSAGSLTGPNDSPWVETFGSGGGRRS